MILIPIFRFLLIQEDLSVTQSELSFSFPLIFCFPYSNVLWGTGRTPGDSNCSARNDEPGLGVRLLLE